MAVFPRTLEEFLFLLFPDSRGTDPMGEGKYFTVRGRNLCGNAEMNSRPFLSVGSGRAKEIFPGAGATGAEKRTVFVGRRHPETVDFSSDFGSPLAFPAEEDSPVSGKHCRFCRLAGNPHPDQDWNGALERKFRISFREWRELMIHSAWYEPEKHLFSLSVAAVPASRLTLSAESAPKRIFRNGKNIETDARENGWALPLNRVAIGWKFCFKVGGRRKKNARPVFYGARVWGVVAFERRCFSEGGGEIAFYCWSGVKVMRISAFRTVFFS